MLVLTLFVYLYELSDGSMSRRDQTIVGFVALVLEEMVFDNG
jgi:hypothetical protein